jgi:DNA mismatch repair protein MutL
MGLIRVLPELLVNRIAAGEVIERPASVVKELIENSLDAEATRIEIAIEQGGHRLIRVTDDGLGMDGDDVTLAVVPHATSKIEREDDLLAIGTMGFRGEALASIGAVSDLRIVSRRQGADEAYEVRMCADRVDGPRATGAPVGTTVEIRDLFAHVPVRRKFLRSPQTEFGHITEQVARLALAHPRVAFVVTHNDREVHRLPPVDSWRQRLADFYGTELAESLMPIEREGRGLKLTGLVAPPAQTRSTARWQYTFVNGRYVRDKFVQHALREAYRGLIDPHRHPVAFLRLQVDPTDVDVNVHPTKIEVRWRDSQAVHSVVLAALRDTFLGSDLTAGLTADGERDAPDPEQRRQKIRQAMADFFKSQPRPSAPASFSEPREQPSFDPPMSFESRRADIIDHQAALPNRVSDEGAAGTRFLQIHNTYLVAETPEGMIIVDQHALHERVLYEQLRRQVSYGPLESQRLLLPVTVEINADQIGVLDEQTDLFTKLGLEVTAFGRNAVAVHACPTMLHESSLVAFVRDLFDCLSGSDVAAEPENVFESTLQMMACKAAVKAGDPLSAQEIEALLAHRGQVDKHTNCPHGRPTTLRLSVADLERQFKRV